MDLSLPSTLSTASSAEEKTLLSAYLDDVQTVTEIKEDNVSAKFIKNLR